MWMASLTLRVYQCGSRSINLTSFQIGKFPVLLACSETMKAWVWAGHMSLSCPFIHSCIALPVSPIYTLIFKTLNLNFQNAMRSSLNERILRLLFSATRAWEPGIFFLLRRQRPLPSPSSFSVTSGFLHDRSSADSNRETRSE